MHQVLLKNVKCKVMFTEAYLFQQIFIVYKTFTVGIKTKNLPRTTRFGLWLFYKGVLQDDQLSQMTTFAWSQTWSSYTRLTAFPKNFNFMVQFNLTLRLFKVLSIVQFSVNLGQSLLIFCSSSFLVLKVQCGIQ